jgi:two-component system CheB/CheR fusion protein
MSERLDDSTPTRVITEPSRVVGLGASAGGIKALKAFFAGAPQESGIAYVVVVHMSPVHDSNPAEVLQSDTKLPVTAVRQAITIEANHVYVVSPDAVLRMEDGRLLVAPVDTLEARRSPIDILFRTLGDAHGARAVAVVLSGSGTDGSRGIERVSKQGGLVIAQEPGEAEYPDMPLNAIRTGVVDFVLPIAAMAERILEYDGHLFEAMVPLDATLRPPDEDPRAERYRQVMTLLRVRTGHDFSNYKPATVLRRISRRMRLHQLTDLGEYASRLQTDALEPQALMKELLISVTHFFRDPVAFAALEARVMPQVLERKTGDDQVRAWVVGCATGEEAYSIAMLCAEAEEQSAGHPAVHVFATDLDEQAVAMAREGHYDEAHVADIAPHRLARFFQRTGQGYRVRRELRERVLFAHHNAIKDPPFSHLDLISCRNMLIYLNRAAQERLLNTFHFALRPGGYLMLGTSESADSAAELFAVVDKAAHIYESRAASSRPESAAAGLLTLPRRTARVTAAELPGKHIFPADLHMRLLEQYAAPSLVVADESTVVHMSEGAARFLQLRGGEPSRDLFKLVRPELRVDLRVALRRALHERTSVETAPIVLHGAGAVRLMVRPVLDAKDPARGYLLIVFEPASGADTPSPVQPAAGQPAALALEEEVARLKDQLRTTVEQYETQVEQAHAANEELQALNEELRSSSEELETSKEELQSVNEELTTVNQELKIKIEELRLVNDDFLNFINATDVGTIFVDRSLRVKLSTARAREVFNLLPSDSGRHLTDITSRLDYPGLTGDLQQVIQTLQPLEREVPATGGALFLLRMTPYRTTEHRIEGAVLTFLDITSRVASERRIRAG